MVIATANRLFRIRYRGIYSTFEAVIPRKKAAFSTGNLMHSFSLRYYIQDAAN